MLDNSSTLELWCGKVFCNFAGGILHNFIIMSQTLRNDVCRDEWAFMFFCLVFAMHLCASVYMCLVVNCWERADLLALVCGV